MNHRSAIARILPIDAIPRLIGTQQPDEYWRSTDSHEEYRRRGGHPVYGERDIVYRYNSAGYRCPEFNVTGDIRILSIGCSVTFGVGLPQGALFHELFAQRLREETGRTVVNWNLGSGGRSCDYVARTLHIAAPILNPDVVLVMFPPIDRREHIGVDGRVYGLTSRPSPDQLADPIFRDIYRHYTELASPQDDQLNFFRNYTSIASLLASHLWLFSFAYRTDVGACEDWLDHSRYIEFIKATDTARDHMHPGPITQFVRYEAYWSRFEQLGWLEIIKTRIRGHSHFGLER